MSNIIRRLPFREHCNFRQIYCDESGLDEQYFLLGALIFDGTDDMLESKIQEIKLKFRINNEIKWQRLPSPGCYYHQGYQALIDFFLESNLRYKVFIVDTSLYPLNHPDYTDSTCRNGYFQYYSTLIFNGFIQFFPKTNFQVFLHNPAYGSSRNVLDLENDINGSARAKGLPKMRGQSCCRIDSVSGKGKSGVQLVDLLTGMVSASWNKKTSAAHKIKFIKDFEAKGNIKILEPTPNSIEEQKFNKWVFTPHRISKK